MGLNRNVSTNISVFYIIIHIFNEKLIVFSENVDIIYKLKIKNFPRILKKYNTKKKIN